MANLIRKLIDTVRLAFSRPAVAPATMADTSEQRNMTAEQVSDMKRLLDDAERRINETHERRLAVINRLRQQLDQRGLADARQQLSE